MPERDSGGQPTPEDQLRALYENAESTAARAFEQAVATPSFGALLARSAENAAALSRIGSDLADLVLRNLRLAGRSDITRLARQLHRTEDKLERVLQEIEQLRDELARAGPDASGSTAASGRGAASGSTAAPGRGAASGATAAPGRGAASGATAVSGRGEDAGASTGNGRASGEGAGTSGRRGGSTRSRSRTT